MYVHKNDGIAKADEEYETELTKLAENAVEKGVNEVVGGEDNRDKDFKIKKQSPTSIANQRKNDSRKKKKQQRQNRKNKRK
jgi:hypothetical protein